MWYLLDKAILGKMVGFDVTYVADADKEQWHLGTLVCSFNRDFESFPAL